MSRYSRFHWLPALALLAALTAAFSAQVLAQIPAQSPTRPSAEPFVQPSAQPAPPPETPTIDSPSSTATPASPALQLTQEQTADLLASHQRYQAAIAAYIKIANPSPAVWNKMGIAYQMMFNLKDAIRCYNASLKLEPHSAHVLNNLATVYDSLKLYKMAERYYHKALKIDPHAALILRNLGSNQLTQHKYKKGWEAYQSALAADPAIFETHSGASVENPASTQERGAMHYYMARGCISAGNSECAIQNLRLALNEGYTNARKIASDSSFASLHELPAFQQMIAAQSPPQ